MPRERRITMNSLTRLPSPSSHRPGAVTILLFSCGTTSCCLVGSVREDTIWILSSAGTVLFGLSFLLPTLVFPRLSPAPYIFHLVGCHSPCSAPPGSRLTHQPDAGWSGGAADSSLATGCAIPFAVQLSHMPPPAQRKSRVPRAVAHGCVNTMRSCDRPSEEMLRRLGACSGVRRETEQGAETQTVSPLYANTSLGYWRGRFQSWRKIRANRSTLFAFEFLSLGGFSSFTLLLPLLKMCFNTLRNPTFC